MDNDKEQRIEQIDKRIKDLEEQRSMWFKAGGPGVRMAMQSVGEIEDLKMEKDDLINGTNNLGIKMKEREISELKRLRDEASFLQSHKYKKQINEREAELERMVQPVEDNAITETKTK